MIFIITMGIIGAVLLGWMMEEAGGFIAGFFIGGLIALIICSEVTSNMKDEKLVCTETRYEVSAASFGEEDKETVLIVSYEDGTIISCDIDKVKLFDSDENYIIVKEYQPKGIAKIFWLGRTRYEVYCQVEGHN